MSLFSSDNPMVRKLSAFEDFDEQDVRVIEDFSEVSRHHPSGKILIEEGDRPENVFLLLEGWACRYKILPDGNRQIMAFLIPGDVCDIQIFLLKSMDHGIALLTDSVVAEISKTKMNAVMKDHSRVTRALLWATLVDEATLREWLVNMGQRNARERMAHLFCELYVRLFQVGLNREHEIRFPLTQEQLADTMGLTPVHVSRVLTKMRDEELISIKGRMLHLRDFERLKQIAQFDPNYLHLDRRHPNL